MFFPCSERSLCTAGESCRWATLLWYCEQIARSLAGCTMASICIPYFQRSSFLSGQHNLHKEKKCIKTISKIHSTPICKILACSESLREQRTSAFSFTVEVAESHVTKCVCVHIYGDKRHIYRSNGFAKIQEWKKRPRKVLEVLNFFREVLCWEFFDSTWKHVCCFTLVMWLIYRCQSSQKGSQRKRGLKVLEDGLSYTRFMT